MHVCVGVDGMQRISYMRTCTRLHWALSIGTFPTTESTRALLWTAGVWMYIVVGVAQADQSICMHNYTLQSLKSLSFPQQLTAVGVFFPQHIYVHTCRFHQLIATRSHDPIHCVPADEVHFPPCIQPTLSNVNYKLQSRFTSGNVHWIHLSHPCTRLSRLCECIVHLIRHWLLQSHCHFLIAIIVLIW